MLDVCTAGPRAGALTWGGYRLVGPDREHIEGRFYHRGQVLAAETEVVRQQLQSGFGLLDRDAFLEQVLFRCVYKLPLRAAFVAWAPEFCIGRLAKGVRVVCDRDGCQRYRFVLWTYLDANGQERTDYFRPRIDITVADAGRVLCQFTWRKNPDPQDRIPEGGTEPHPGYVFRGRFLSLYLAVYALTGEELSLVDACRAFEVEPPPAGEPTLENMDARLQALSGLYRAVMVEFEHWPSAPWLAPDRALSPSSLGKSLLRRANLPAPLGRRPAEPRRALGAAMAAYVGPRSEVRLRHVPLPVAYVDAHSTYLLMGELMHTSELLTHQVEVRHLTHHREVTVLQERLTGIGAKHLLRQPELWPTLLGVALASPDWDVLPSKAAYGAGTEETTALSPVASARQPILIAYPDLISSALKTGRLPEILEAWEWHPQTAVPDLGHLHLPGLQRPDRLGRDDPSFVLAQARQQLADDPTLTETVRGRRRGLLKVIGNAIAYGAEIEFNRGCMPCDYTVYGPTGQVSVHEKPERPGWLCYPPLATLTVAGARLMIGLLEQLVHETGGELVWIDTDGGCLVANEQGCLIPCPGGPHRNDAGQECVKALSYTELQRIRRRFAPLAKAVGFIPLEPDPLGGRPFRSVFKIEPHNLDERGRFRPGLECTAVSVKNYVLNRRDPDGNPIADPNAKFSAHAMGNLVSPIAPGSNDSSWIPEAWLWWLRRREDRDPLDPAWVDLPVMHAMQVAHPYDYQQLHKLNRGKTYDEQIKPFDALLLPHLDRFHNPNAAPRRLIALWEPDPTKWLELDFFDPTTASRHRLAVQRRTGSYRDWQKPAGSLFVESMRTYLEKHFTHPEPASLGPDGQPCGQETRGLLTPIPIQIEGQHLVGKETHRLRERRAGWSTTNEERVSFTSPDEIRTRLLPVLADAPEHWLRTHGLEPRTLRKLGSRDAQHITTRLAQRIEQAATAFAREQLQARGHRAPANPQAACVAYLEQRTRACDWPGCTTPLEHKQRRWCPKHARRSGKDRAY
jgi:hypothetical protein